MHSIKYLEQVWGQKTNFFLKELFFQKRYFLKEPLLKENGWHQILLSEELYQFFNFCTSIHIYKYNAIYMQNAEINIFSTDLFCRHEINKLMCERLDKSCTL